MSCTQRLGDPESSWKGRAGLLFSPRGSFAGSAQPEGSPGNGALQWGLGVWAQAPVPGGTQGTVRAVPPPRGPSQS